MLNPDLFFALFIFRLDIRYYLDDNVVYRSRRILWPTALSDNVTNIKTLNTTFISLKTDGKTNVKIHSYKINVNEKRNEMY